MNDLRVFLPCAAGVEDWLAAEAARITGLPAAQVQATRGGVSLHAPWRSVMALNLHSRLAQRVLVQLAHQPYRAEQDLYEAAHAVAWEAWFTPRERFKIEVTAQRSPLKSLNFAGLRIKDAIADRFRERAGARPDVDTAHPDMRIYLHLTQEQATLYIDTSGEPLFKRGWREDKGDAPLKETLAAAMIAASGWADGDGDLLPLYDPCCGSGTVVIEAAQIACNIAAGSMRRFAFEKYRPFRAQEWAAMKAEAAQAVVKPEPGQATLIFGSDVSHRMVDFAQRNAQRAGVADVIEFRGGDALQRMPPCATPGVMLVNPPYGERIEAGGFAGKARWGARELPETEQADDGNEFFSKLATHWKKNYSGWTAWVLTPDLKLPGKMRLKESRRVPMWNGPLECRLFKFEMIKGAVRERPAHNPANTPAKPPAP